MRNIWVFIAIATVLRAAFAAYLPLGVDEAYQVAVGSTWTLSYYDHPPISFWAPQLAKLFELSHPFFHRLPSLIIGVFSTYLLWRITLMIGSSRAAWIAVILYVLSPFFFSVGGVFINPDFALNFGILLAVFGVLNLVQNPRLSMWLCLGVGIAVAFMSKYQAAFVGIVLLAAFVFESRLRAQIFTKGFALAFVIALLGCFPVLIWNIQNDWASFQFHTGRANDGTNPMNVVFVFLGQILLLMPATFVFCLIAAGQRQFWQRTETRILLWLAALPIAFFNIIYLFSQDSYPHWTMPGWLMLLPIAGIYLEKLIDKRSVKLAFILPALPIWGILILLTLHARTGILTNGYDEIPAWDNTRPLIVLDGLQDEMQKRGIAPDYIAAVDWLQAGHLTNALKDNIPVKVLGESPHHFAFTAGANATGEGLLFTLAHLSISPYSFDGLEELDPIILPRGPRDYMRVQIFRLSDSQ